jgi:hypothetical protein
VLRSRGCLLAQPQLNEAEAIVNIYIASFPRVDEELMNFQSLKQAHGLKRLVWATDGSHDCPFIMFNTLVWVWSVAAPCWLLETHAGKVSALGRLVTKTGSETSRWDKMFELKGAYMETHRPYLV